MANKVAAVLVLAMLGVSAVAGQDASAGTSTVSVQFVGNSGKIKLFTVADTNNFIQISQSKLQEVDANGNNVNQRSVNLATTGGGWGALATTTADGVTSYSTTYNATFEVGKQGQNPGTTVNFLVTAALYQSATTVQYGNDTVQVYANSVKFSVSLNNWPFAASTNKLQYGIAMASKGNGTATKSSGGSANQEKIEVSNGFLESPTFALIDGAAVDITTTLDTQGNANTITWAFPAGNTIEYDPVLGVDAAEGSDSGSGSMADSSTATGIPPAGDSAFATATAAAVPFLVAAAVLL